MYCSRIRFFIIYYNSNILKNILNDILKFSFNFSKSLQNPLQLFLNYLLKRYLHGIQLFKINCFFLRNDHFTQKDTEIRKSILYVRRLNLSARYEAKSLRLRSSRREVKVCRIEIISKPLVQVLYGNKTIG